MAKNNQWDVAEEIDDPDYQAGQWDIAGEINDPDYKPKDASFGDVILDKTKQAAPASKAAVGGLTRQLGEFKPESTVYNFARRAFTALSPISARVVNKSGDVKDAKTIDQIFGSDFEKKGLDWYRAGQQKMAEMEPQTTPGTFKRYVGDVVGATAIMIPALLAGAVTRNPNTTLTVMFPQVFGMEYGAAREKGLTPDQAQLQALVLATSEILTEKIPLDVLFSKAGKGPLRKLLKVAGLEFGQEAIQGAVEQLVSTGVLHGKMTASEAAAIFANPETWKKIGYQGLVGLGMGASMASPVTAYELFKGPDAGDGPVAPKVFTDGVPVTEPEVPPDVPADETPVTEPPLDPVQEGANTVPGETPSDEWEVVDEILDDGTGEPVVAPAAPEGEVQPPAEGTVDYVPPGKAVPEPVQTPEFTTSPGATGPVPVPDGEIAYTPDMERPAEQVNKDAELAPAVPDLKYETEEQARNRVAKEKRELEKYQNRAERIINQNELTKNIKQPEGLDDSRIKRLDYRKELANMAGDLTPGGGIALIDDPADTSNIINKKKTRTPSVNPQWFQGIVSQTDMKVSVKKLQHIVRKALLGAKLTPKQATIVEAMLDEVSDRRGSPENVTFAQEELTKARDARRNLQSQLTPDLADISELTDTYPEIAYAGELFEEGEYEAGLDLTNRMVQEAAEVARENGADPERLFEILESEQTDKQVLGTLTEYNEELKNVKQIEAESKQAEGTGPSEKEREPEPEAKEAPTEEKNVMPYQEKMPTPNLIDMQKNPDYWRDKKNKEFSITRMTPDSYLQSVADGFGSSVESIIEDTTPKLVDEYAESMEKGDKFPILILDYSSDSFSQEGRHRALAAKKAGFKTVPVAEIMVPGDQFTKAETKAINNKADRLKTAQDEIDFIDNELYEWFTPDEIIKIQNEGPNPHEKGGLKWWGDKLVEGQKRAWPKGKEPGKNQEKVRRLLDEEEQLKKQITETTEEKNQAVDDGDNAARDKSFDKLESLRTELKEAENKTYAAMSEAAKEKNQEKTSTRPVAESQAPATSEPGNAAVAPGQEGVGPVSNRPTRYGDKNKAFKKTDAEKARELLKKKLNQLNVGLDPEMMQAGITLAGYHVEAGARAFADYSKAMIDELGEAIKPYLRSFYEAVRHAPGIDNDGMSTADEIDAYLKSEEAENVPTTAESVEPDREGSETKDTLGKENVQPDSGTEGRGTGETGGPDVVSGVPEQGDRGISGDNASVDRTGSINDLFDQDWSSRPEKGPTGTGKRGRSSASNDAGASVDTETSGAAERAAEHAQPNFDQKLAAQKKAGNKKVVYGDLANIKETLPVLYPEQQDDVVKAETRFFEKNGKGMMFTNGTGTGKTYTGLGIIKRSVMNGKGRILIVLPNNGKIRDWIEDGKDLFLNIKQLKNTKDVGKGVVTTTYANFRTNQGLAEEHWDMVVYDESHLIMESMGGKETSTSNAHYITTNQKESSFLAKAKIKLRDEYGAIKQRERELKEEFETAQNNDQSTEQKAYKTASEKYDNGMIALDRKKAVLNERAEKMSFEYQDREKESPTKVVFLSATPWAGHQNIFYADQYLYDIKEGYKQSGAYNAGDSYQQFLVKNFGYKMRYGRAEYPDAEVDIGLLEREFHEKLVAAGSLSGRPIEVDKDYSREFVMTSAGVGADIDRGFSIIFDSRIKTADGKSGYKYPALSEYLRETTKGIWKYRMLESIKAKSSIDRIKQHIKMGRKVIVFHTYIEGAPTHPFKFPSTPGMPSDFINERTMFEAENKDLVNLNLEGLDSVPNTLKKEFGDRLTLYNGTIPNKQRTKGMDEFNKDGGKIDTIVLQKAAGKMGISLHDVTGIKAGGHQRVLIVMGLPTSPTDVIQIEGRPYRLGVQSNVPYEYPVIDQNFERFAYGTLVSNRASTAENLAMGNGARALDVAFREGYLSPTSTNPNDKQGIGGKESDGVERDLSEFDRAKTYYWKRGKKTSRTKSAEGENYFATPEPLGMKMVQWADILPNNKVLEPSGGHGAIARFFPSTSVNRAIEPASGLASELSMVMDGEVVHEFFEDHNVVNKYDNIVMNPPFGIGGSKAIPHLKKAFKHLRNGGRLVAVLPDGPASNRRLNKFIHGLEKDAEKELFVSANIKLPNFTFERAGTTTAVKIIIIDKFSNPENAPNVSERDFSDAQDMNDLFDRIEESEIPPRNKPTPKVARSPRFEKKDPDSPLLSRYSSDVDATDAKAQRGMPVSAVKDVVEQFKRLFKNKIGVDFIVANKGSDVFTRSQLGEIGSEFKGAYLPVSKKVVLIASNIRDAQDAVTTIQHEILGHYGLNLFDHAVKKNIIKILKNSREGKKIKEVFLNVERLYHDKSKNIQAEEVFAFIAQENISTSWGAAWDRIVEIIANALRKIGFLRGKATRAEINNLVRAIGGAIHRGSQQRNYSDIEMEGQRVTPTRQDTETINAAVRDIVKDERLLHGSWLGFAGRLVRKVENKLHPLASLEMRREFLIDRGLTQGQIARSQETAKEIYEFFKKATESDARELYDFLTDANSDGSKIGSEKLREKAIKVKSFINRIGRSLVDHGVIPQESYDNYENRYLPRLYLAYLLGDKAISAAGAGKSISDKGYAKQRNEDLSQEYRDVVLGELKDAAFLASKAIGIPLRDIALMDWFARISENTQWSMKGQIIKFIPYGKGKARKVTPYWLKAEAQKLRQIANYYTDNELRERAIEEASRMDMLADVRLEEIGLDTDSVPKDFKKMPNSPRYGGLRGLVVRKEIYDDIIGTALSLDPDAGFFQSLFNYGGTGTKITQWWKWSKVAANPPAQIRNIVSNLILLHLSGVPLYRIVPLLIRAVKEIRTKGRYYKIILKHGVTVSTFAANEMIRIDREMLDLHSRSRGGIGIPHLQQIAGTIVEYAGDAYQMSETVGKLMKVMYEMEVNNMPEGDAVMEAQEWLFDYSLVGKNTRFLRNAPIGAPFLTFYIKVLPRLLEVATTAPWRFLPYAALINGLPYLVGALSGADDDDMETLQKTLPDWLQDRGDALFLPGRDKYGRWRAVDIGYFLPWTMWTDISKKIGNSVYSTVTGEGVTQWGELISMSGLFTGPLSNVMAVALTGKDPFTGKQVVRGEDTGDEQVAAILTYGYNMFAPPWLTGAWPFNEYALTKGASGHLYEAVTGRVNRYGDPKSTVPQALARFVGVNIYPIEPEKSRAFNLRNRARQIEAVKSIMNRRLSDPNVDSEDRDEYKAKYMAKIKRMINEMNQYAKDSKVPESLR